MIQFVTIHPQWHAVQTIEADSFETAVRAAGLTPGQVDFGIVSRDDDGGIAIVVYEFGLFVPPHEQHYFALGERLFAGSALLYRFDAQGVTVDLDSMPSYFPPPRFFDSAEDVEDAIGRGLIARPRMTVNGQEYWRWPQARPTL